MSNNPPWLLSHPDFDRVYRFVTNPRNLRKTLPRGLDDALDCCMDYSGATDFLDSTPEFDGFTWEEIFDLLFDLANVTDEPVTEAAVLAFKKLYSTLTPPVYEYPRSKPITLRIT